MAPHINVRFDLLSWTTLSATVNPSPARGWGRTIRGRCGRSRPGARSSYLWLQTRWMCRQIVTFIRVCRGGFHRAVVGFADLNLDSDGLPNLKIGSVFVCIARINQQLVNLVANTIATKAYDKPTLHLLTIKWGSSSPAPTPNRPFTGWVAELKRWTASSTIQDVNKVGLSQKDTPRNLF